MDAPIDPSCFIPESDPDEIRNAYGLLLDKLLRSPGSRSLAVIEAYRIYSDMKRRVSDNAAFHELLLILADAFAKSEPCAADELRAAAAKYAHKLETSEAWLALHRSKLSALLSYPG